MKLQITDATVERSTVNGPRGSFTSERQFAWLDLPSGERRKVRIRLRDGKAYAPGHYVVGDASFIVSQYGDLQLGALELVPVAAAPASKLAG